AKIVEALCRVFRSVTPNDRFSRTEDDGADAGRPEDSSRHDDLVPVHVRLETDAWRSGSENGLRKTDDPDF
nr:hypothetical protein [Tanacetum cinerariifolium]